MDEKESKKLFNTIFRNERTDVSDMEAAIEGAKIIFCSYVNEKFSEDSNAFPEVYFILSDEFDLSEAPGITISRIEGDMREIVDDFARAVFISYFSRTADPKFAKRFIEEISSDSEMKKLKKAVSNIESGTMSEASKTLKKFREFDVLALYMWSCSSKLHDAMSRFVAYVGRDITNHANALASESCERESDKTKRMIRKQIERKLHKPLNEAIYESYISSKSSDSAQSILPTMPDSMADRFSKLAADGICEYIVAAAAARCRASQNLFTENGPSIMSFVSYDAEKAVYEGTYLTAVLATAAQSISMSRAVLDQMKVSYSLSDSAIKTSCEKAVQKAEKEKEQAVAEAKRARSQNEVLKKRAAQAEARMRHIQKKPSDVQKQAGEEIRKLKKAVQKLQDEKEELLRKNEKLKKELDLVQEAYAEQPTEEMAKDVDAQAKYLFVTNKDIMIRKLHAWFPNCVISSETNVRSLTGVKLVIFLCAEVSHQEYYKVKAMTKSLGIPSAHCSRISYEAICDCIRNKGSAYGQ